MKTTREILNLDPISTVESFIGKNHKDWDWEAEGKEAFAFSMEWNAYKRNHLKRVKDTYFGISWGEFKGILDEEGFVCGYRKEFHGREHIEEEVIYFHEAKGLIVFADSYRGKSINSAHLYGEVYSKELTGDQWTVLQGFSMSSNGDGTISFSLDMREGFRNRLNDLSEVFEFSKTWSTEPFMWFMNYMETNKDSNRYRIVTKGKIEEALPGVKKIIYG